MPKHSLKGSERPPLSGARSIGKADPEERLEVTVIVRHRAEGALQDKVKELLRESKYTKREDFSQQFGADSRDIQAVRQFANDHGILVVQEDPARRTVVLSGTVAQFNNAFNVDLEQFEHAGGSYRGRTGPVYIPDELMDVIQGVFGLDNRPQALPHFRIRPADSNGRLRPTSNAFTPINLASLYNFPAGTGKGECIGIIELGGGFRTADLNTYFSGLNLTSPNVSAVSIGKGTNNPTGDPTGPDGEVMLDIEVAGTIAPDANIVVYFALNDDQGFLNAITTAIHDSTNKPSVISISWGNSESKWTQQAMTAFDQAFQDAATLGVTICVAAGDNGSSDGVNDGADHVDFPASSPYALGCGGTNLRANGSITSEVVWNAGGATGGGVSNSFALPVWQEGLQVVETQNLRTVALGMRGVPDVAGDADPKTGYNIRVDGRNLVAGGTSAVAPLWAGLVARLNQATGSSVGYLNPTLYRNPAALNDITQGNNGDFSAAAGWDACTGLGSPNGQRILLLWQPDILPWLSLLLDCHLKAALVV